MLLLRSQYPFDVVFGQRAAVQQHFAELALDRAQVFQHTQFFISGNSHRLFSTESREAILETIRATTITPLCTTTPPPDWAAAGLRGDLIGAATSPHSRD